ncbi:tyrosine-type recombinase/integrase [Domibacillus mangrovi]|uniref:Integrase n=1 Tax=Domibacillus mangrovi TaxID=1714354 RepID=A0A1Q5P346_9BACI|nr:site-specific integrase [Domibacillus mangrovi]OKL36680.1 hypothetical protein BLL40_08050 [Domibacillus mangrovi]
MTSKIDLHSIEDIINGRTVLSQALLFMKEHRYWSSSTFDSYQYDVKLFEAYLITQGLEPNLESGQHLTLVHKWIVEQTNAGVAYKTIMRRVAALSSLYAFYKELGTIQTNAFKASSVPGEHSEAHSRAMDMTDLKKVYRAIEGLKEYGIYIGVPIKLLLFTGLRNQAITHLKVKNIVWEEGLLVYDVQAKNSKNKYQVLPLPLNLLNELHTYVEKKNLVENDPLCYGIKGYPLKNKQLNALVNKVNEYLKWDGEKRVTPHGFRYTIATILDERGLSIETIKYLLGHRTTDNVQFYLRRNERKIKELKDALTIFESELEDSLLEEKEKLPAPDLEKISKQKTDTVQVGLPYSEEFILQLSKSNPKLLEKIMLEYYSPNNNY